MTDQLHLLPSRPAWQLDRATRERGRRGVAGARAVLRAAQARARAAELAEGSETLPTAIDDTGSLSTAA